MSAEKFFQHESAVVLFVSVALFGCLRGVLGSVSAVLRCASMLVSVTFNVGMRDDCICWLCSAGKEISQEEGANPL